MLVALYKYAVILWGVTSVLLREKKKNLHSKYNFYLNYNGHAPEVLTFQVNRRYKVIPVHLSYLLCCFLLNACFCSEALFFSYLQVTWVICLLVFFSLCTVLILEGFCRACVTGHWEHLLQEEVRGHISRTLKLHWNSYNGERPLKNAFIA